MLGEVLSGLGHAMKLRCMCADSGFADVMRFPSLTVALSLYIALQTSRVSCACRMGWKAQMGMYDT
jgi:hypothetical protein